MGERTGGGGEVNTLLSFVSCEIYFIFTQRTHVSHSPLPSHSPLRPPTPPPVPLSSSLPMTVASVASRSDVTAIAIPPPLLPAFLVGGI